MENIIFVDFSKKKKIPLKPFESLTDKFYSLGLTRSQAKVYNHLVRLGSLQSEDGDKVSANSRVIASDLGINPITVRRAIKDLEVLGFIKYELCEQHKPLHIRLLNKVD